MSAGGFLFQGNQPETRVDLDVRLPSNIPDYYDKGLKSDTSQGNLNLIIIRD